MEEDPHRGSPLSEGFLAGRRARVERVAGRALASPSCMTLPAAHGAHLRQEAEELYWNELAWEQITAEEMVGGSQRVERAFPAFLALIDGLLLGRRPVSGEACPVPRRDVVEDVLRFLAGRCAAQTAAGTPDAALECDLATRLVDLVLYRQHGLRVEEVERLEIARLGGDE